MYLKHFCPVERDHLLLFLWHNLKIKYTLHLDSDLITFIFSVVGWGDPRKGLEKLIISKFLETVLNIVMKNKIQPFQDCDYSWLGISLKSIPVLQPQCNCLTLLFYHFHDISDSATIYHSLWASLMSSDASPMPP